MKVVLLALATMVGLVACGSGQGAPDAASSSSVVSDGLPQGDEEVEIDPGEFTAEIDNRFWPMTPGTRWTYRETEPEGENLDVVVIVTTETRQLANGVTARVVRDTVTQDGEIIEDTFDWYAQDSAGNVWYMGEDTAEFEDGEMVSAAGSWEAGVDGALPGIIIPANPAPGMSYRQEYYAGEAEDNGQVLSIEEMVDVTVGHFDNVLMTKDTTSLEPDVLEYKLYAPEVGPVLVLGVSGGGGQEELVLIDQAPDGAGTGPLGEPNP
jgi:hypothetical protein